MKEEVVFTDSSSVSPYLLSVVRDKGLITITKGDKPPSQFRDLKIIPQVPSLAQWGEKDGMRYQIGAIVLQYLEELFHEAP